MITQCLLCGNIKCFDFMCYFFRESCQRVIKSLLLPLDCIKKLVTEIECIEISFLCGLPRNGFEKKNLKNRF